MGSLEGSGEGTGVGRSETQRPQVWSQTLANLQVGQKVIWQASWSSARTTRQRPSVPSRSLQALGAGVGTREGAVEGRIEGTGVGVGMGAAVGAPVGAAEGAGVGGFVGAALGSAVGASDGAAEGIAEGAGEGAMSPRPRPAEHIKAAAVRTVGFAYNALQNKESPYRTTSQYGIYAPCTCPPVLYMHRVRIS